MSTNVFERPKWETLTETLTGVRGEMRCYLRYLGENLENDRDQDGTKEVVDIEIFQQIFQHRGFADGI